MIHQSFLALAISISIIYYYFTLQYSRQHLLSFMFRHGRYKEACLLFFPADSLPHPSPPGVVTSTSSPQRPDPLATDYGTVDDLCDLCVGYGAMPVLEEVISARIAITRDQLLSQHTTAAVSRICVYCETHKHFNYLYRFQVCVLLPFWFLDLGYNFNCLK